jgi:hypothetical protein
MLALFLKRTLSKDGSVPGHAPLITFLWHVLHSYLS